ncbi:MAG: hypothetical protein V4515_00555 [Chloroflexota bacterium]
MEHSIAAKYAARPAASFPRPSARIRERRLGLGSAVAFRARSGRSTELRRETGSSLASIRGGTRSITPTRARLPGSGRPRPRVSMTWSRSVRIHRSSAVTAPWLG